MHDEHDTTMDISPEDHTVKPEAAMPAQRSSRGIGVFPALLGLTLIALGLLFLVGQLFGFKLGALIWPVFIIGPGVLAYFAALALVEEPVGEVLIIPASIVTMTGLLLFYQNLTQHWESWAYAWALIAPTSIGLGQILYGRVKSKPEISRIGRGLVSIGSIVFLTGFAFFELLLNISGFGLSRISWPILLIGLGGWLIFKTLLGKR